MRDSHPQTLIIDLTFTKTIDSKGLSLLLTLQKMLAERQVGVTLKNPNRHLRDIFRIMQFDHLFTVDQDS
jgi:anti-anti-sigma factor